MTGIIKVGKELDKIKFFEEALDYHFKANKEKKHPSFKRHILFKEISEDFEREVSSYGFCPYIHKPFAEQIKDKNLMKFKKNPFVNFFYAYAKLSNKSIEETNKEKLLLESTKKKKKVRIKKNKAFTPISSQQSDSENGDEKLTNKEKSDVFLSKGLNTIKSRNSLFGGLLVDTNFKSRIRKKLKKNTSAPNFKEFMGGLGLDQSLLKQKSRFDIYKKIEKSVNDPNLKEKMIPLISGLSNGFNQNQSMPIQTFGRKKIEMDNKANENVMISMLKTRYNLMKEKEMDQKRKNILEMEKERELEIQRKLKSKAKLAKQKRIKMENEIMKEKDNIFNLASVQHKRNEFLQQRVDEEDEQLSDNDPLIVYGLIKKKSKN